MKNALNITREQNFPDWYQEVVDKADLAETSLSRGSMVVKPYGNAIWENIKNIFDKKIKELGVQNALFPALIPVELLEKEAEHVAGFAKECVVITHHRLVQDKGTLIPDPNSKLEKPYILRPTSETIIGESFSKWINSYRDLPLLINQWGNVFRWEMRTRLFLRSVEFFWQEGHCVFKDNDGAEENAKTFLNVYKDLAENYMAIYSYIGQKTDDEKFAGADKTYSLEPMMQDGKAVQFATSHNLGQHFTKSSDIKFTDENGKEQFAYSTSWGFSTRSIGALIMSHSDDDGLVLPPKIAPYPIVIIPVIHNEDKKSTILEYCNKIKNAIKCDVYIDNGYDSPQNKKWNWVRKGAPLRLEIGERDTENNSIFYVRRDKILEKNNVSFDDFVNKYQNELDELQNNLLQKSKENLYKNTKQVENIEEIKKIIKDKVFISIPASLWQNKELEKIMEENSVSYRNKPFELKDRIIIGKAY
ncbi:MAG: proline--tRNA ligase [Rickettsiales bacterium]|jgi:prolyl-tRNA synthetase|nr:proline--tRNA ligase [Rickettsiales bacterium]